MKKKKKRKKKKKERKKKVKTICCMATLGFMQRLTNLASMTRKHHIASIKDRLNANDINFIFVLMCHIEMF